MQSARSVRDLRGHRDPSTCVFLASTAHTLVVDPSIANVDDPNVAAAATPRDEPRRDPAGPPASQAL
jgi:hypothetical protein